MTRKNIFFLIALSLMVTSSCQRNVDGEVTREGFNETPATFPVAAGLIDEASGIADSRINNNALWVEQDGGNPAEIALISSNAALIKKIPISNVVNRDWEDMSISTDPATGKNRLYIADIGDNNLQYTDYAIYRFEEPSQNTTAVTAVDKISFKYPDGPHDAEAILVDDASQDIYIITKRDAVSKIYRLSYPQSTSSIITAEVAGSLSYNGVTSAAVSPGGNEIIIKTYTAIYYYKKAASDKIPDALVKQPVNLAYTMEPQGEAVCFKKDNSGFFTLSERGVSASVDLRFYSRK